MQCLNPLRRIPSENETFLFSPARLRQPVLIVLGTVIVYAPQVTLKRSHRSGAGLKAR